MEAVNARFDIKKVKIREFLEKLQTTSAGLSTFEARSRRQKSGFNEIPEKKQYPFAKFLRCLWGPIPIMIEAAAILSLLVQHYTDFAAIMVLLLINTVVGFRRDRRADNAIEMLKQKLAPQARARRDGAWITLPSRQLAPGDIIRLRPGDIVPADVKLIDGDFLECDESALGGESLPVQKLLLDEAYSGAVVSRGEMTAAVEKTGLNTFFGKTAKLAEEAKSKSRFEQALIRIGNYLIVMAVFLILVIFIVAIFRHENLVDILRFALVLTIASIPAALAAILTATMAAGAANLAQKKAVARKLAAIEELAGMDVLCSDKTGALTQNQPTVAEPFPAPGYNKEDVLLYAALASREEDNDSIDNAILKRLKQYDSLKAQLLQFSFDTFTPFDPLIKRAEGRVRNHFGQPVGVTKGAPQAIFNLIHVHNFHLKNFQDKVDDFARMGYRTIAVAVAPEGKEWQMAGLIPLFDPPREDSAETISNAKNMGVKVKMLTGDNLAIARQIAGKLNLGNRMIPAKLIETASAAQLEEIAEKADGFAEVFPEHKFSIVSILQKSEHFVGMAGGGVNDAPALRKADCGIAVAGATDAAKSAASIVLTAPGLSVIIDAIKDSRKIFYRMNSYAIYRLAETIRLLFFITLSILIFDFYPVTAVMIVLIVLLNYVPIMAIASDNAHYSETPEKWNMQIVLGPGTILGLMGVVSSFIIFYLGQQVFRLNGEALQSFIFLKLAIAGHLTIFLSRTRGPFWSIKPSRGLLWSAIISQIAATLFAVYGWFVAPIGWKMALFVWGYAIVAFLLSDLLKIYFYKMFNGKALPLKSILST